MKNPKTKVIFRIWPKSQGGEVIAIFPRDCGTNDPATCSSYMHTGQHASCDPAMLARTLKLAKPDEYAALKKELENYGPPEAHYNLDVRTRCTRADYEARKAQLAQMRQPEPAKGDLEKHEFTLPASWASYLVNGDSSGLSGEEISEADFFMATHFGDGSKPMATCGDSFFAKRNDANKLAGDVCEYVFLTPRNKPFSR